MRRIEATYTTVSRSSVRGEGGWYRWNGDPDKSEAAKAGKGSADRRAAAGSGGAVLAGRRRERVEKFKTALAGLGHNDPAEAPDEAVDEAGILVGVGRKTARSYRTSIRQQREREQAAAAVAAIGEDATPAEIAAALRKQIAGFSPGHAALVAEYEQLRAGAQQS